MSNLILFNTYSESYISIDLVYVSGLKENNKMEKFTPVDMNYESDSSEAETNVEIEIVVYDEFHNNSYEESDNDTSLSINYDSNGSTIILSSDDDELEEEEEEDGEQEHNDGDLSEIEVMYDDDFSDYDFHYNDYNEYYDDDDDVLNIDISDEEVRYLSRKNYI